MTLEQRIYRLVAESIKGNAESDACKGCSHEDCACCEIFAEKRADSAAALHRDINEEMGLGFEFFETSRRPAEPATSYWTDKDPWGCEECIDTGDDPDEWTDELTDEDDPDDY